MTAADTVFEDMEVRLVARDGALHLEDLRLAAQGFALRGTAAIGMNGELAGSAMLRIDPDFSGALIQSVHELQHLADALDEARGWLDHDNPRKGVQRAPMDVLHTKWENFRRDYVEAKKALQKLTQSSKELANAMQTRARTGSDGGPEAVLTEDEKAQVLENARSIRMLSGKLDIVPPPSPPRGRDGDEFTPYIIGLAEAWQMAVEAKPSTSERSAFLNFVVAVVEAHGIGVDPPGTWRTRAWRALKGLRVQKSS